MITFDRFPDGKQFCVTFSYDDGPTEDIRLAKLFNKYNLKATFNINDSFFKFNDVSSLKTRYAGHEMQFLCFPPRQRRYRLREARQSPSRRASE